MLILDFLQRPVCREEIDTTAMELAFLKRKQKVCKEVNNKSLSKAQMYEVNTNFRLNTITRCIYTHITHDIHTYLPCRSSGWALFVVDA